MGFDTRTIIKSSAPTINDDIDKGINIGYKWVDNSSYPAQWYECVDANSGAAIWFPIATNQDNYVVINKTSDFPAPVTGVITLLDDYKYIISGNINIGTDRIVLGNNTSISGVNHDTDKLIYTGSGNMFTSSDANFKLCTIGIDCANGTVFNVSDTTVLKHYLIQEVVFNNINTLGTFDGGYKISFQECEFYTWDNGITIGAANPMMHFIFHNNFIMHTRNSGTGGTTFITFTDTSILDNFKLIASHFHSKNIGDIAIHQNGALITQYSSIIANDFEYYTGSPISGFTVNDFDWVVKANGGLHDSQEFGGIKKTFSLTEQTNFPLTNTYYVPAGITILETGSARFSQSANYTIQYDGKEDFDGIAIQSGSALGTAAGKIYEVTTLVNDSIYFTCCRS